MHIFCTYTRWWFVARGSYWSKKKRSIFTAHFSALFARVNTFVTSSAAMRLCLIQCITNLTEVVSNLKLIPNGKNCCSTVDTMTKRRCGCFFVIFIQANEGDLKCLKSVNSIITFFVVKLILFSSERWNLTESQSIPSISPSTWSRLDSEKVVNFLWFYVASRQFLN